MARRGASSSHLRVHTSLGQDPPRHRQTKPDPTRPSSIPLVGDGVAWGWEQQPSQGTPGIAVAGVSASGSFASAQRASMHSLVLVPAATAQLGRTVAAMG